ncbi:indole-3-glycerol phosphate synthase [Helicobacter monodelphidis]|uniref:indole-3-glycerol phosphate synthase TrpC n=1 Tax=Helicobacter sp. 15-1451 TaxID=2004995 RepID=UPI000DCCC799|nr:indole-3-glycerol phosphate synthase TrpC [Helicobacter sp. 15-1451]RAX58349.1 indole-3-glycerol phosphate synthase [Helicobacter sp. 15-1451]
MLLDEILKCKKERLKQAQKKMSIDWLGRSLPYNPFVPRNFKGAVCQNRINIIAEIKKANPSKGITKEYFNPLQTAQDYELGLATAISICTEEDFFQGSLEDLSQIKRFLRIPILRKDFIFDSYQIVESAVYGADSLLLIATILSKKELQELITFSRRFGIEPLVEIHSKTELLKAIAAGADMISINHQNWEDLSIDMKLSQKLAPLIPKGKVVVTESELHSSEQIQEYLKIGIDAFLVGESFMQQENQQATILALNSMD